MGICQFRHRKCDANKPAEALGENAETARMGRRKFLAVAALSPFAIRNLLSEPAQTKPAQQDRMDAIREYVARGLREAVEEVEEYYKGAATGGRAGAFSMWLRANSFYLQEEIGAAIGRNEFGVWDNSAKTLAYCVGVWLGERYFFHMKPGYAPARYTKFGLNDQASPDEANVA